MQTFLPYPSFAQSAKSLYWRIPMNHLGKQRVETMQIMIALLENRGWIHHPAVKMWRGYESSLLAYQKAMCDEWTYRHGYKDTCLMKTIALYHEHGHRFNPVKPPWLGNRKFHRAHQSKLVQKYPDHYRKLFPKVPDDLDYIWPVS